MYVQYISKTIPPRHLVFVSRPVVWEMVIHALLIQTSVFPGTDRETKSEFWGKYLFSKSPVSLKESLLLIYLN